MSEYSLISIINQLQIMNKIIYIQPLVLFVCIHSFRSDSQTSSIWNPSDRNNPSPYFIFQTEFSLFKRFKTKTKTKTKKKKKIFISARCRYLFLTMTQSPPPANNRRIRRHRRAATRRIFQRRSSPKSSWVSS